MKKALLIPVLFLLTAMGPNVPAGDAAKPVSPWEINKLEKTKAPEFTLRDLQGRPVSIASFRGKVILLNFWATWCPSCIAEMPAFEKSYHQMRERGLEVVAVSTDRSLGDVKVFLEKRPVTFTVMLDETRQVTRQYKVFSLPTTFLIDRNGVIVEKFFGEYDWSGKEIRQKIEKLL
jgi:peroxiredoxin